MKNNLTKNICCARSYFFKTLLFSLFLLHFITTKAQQYTETFASAPAFTQYPGVPSWIQTATVTQGGTVYQFVNAGNGGWQFVNTGGSGNSSNLLYSTAATTFVTIKRQDDKRFQFYGAWLKYTNFSGGYTPPWVRVQYNGSALPDETYNSNTTVTLSKNVNVTSVTIYFSGLHDLNFDNIIVGPATPIAPVATTDDVSMFSNTSATLGGSVSDDGGATVTESGLVYGTTTAPTTANNKMALSSGVSSFSQTVTGLQNGTTYYVRSYAINSAGTSYGNQSSFTTFGTFTMAGSHNFNTAWASTYYQNSPFTKYVEGWDVTGKGTAAGAIISVYRLTGANAGEGVSSVSVVDESYPENLMYMSMKPHDGSVFNLQSFKFRYDVQDYGTSFGTITVKGYKNGVAVAGATQNISGLSPASDVPAYNNFIATANAFNNIDEFRLTASGSANSAAIYSFDIDAITATALGALPVTIASINAYQKNMGVQVEWNIATEANINHYEIERSQTGQQFIKATEVAPKANNYGGANYTWYDANASAGNNFYRIKSVSNTGTVMYSQIVNVVIGGKESIAVNPNPIVGNTINLQLNNQPMGTYTVQLYSNTGQQLYNKTFEHTGGSSTQPLDIKGGFVKGVYQLKVSGPLKSYNQQVIKN